MSSKEKIAKLEGLLARIKDRAAEPRLNGVTAHAAFAAAFEVESAAPAPLPVAAARPPSVTPADLKNPTNPPLSIGSRGTSPPTSTAVSEAPPPAMYSDPPQTSVEYEDSDLDEADMDVEVSSEVVEVDIDVDEPGTMPAESGSQPVADHVEAAELEEAPEELLAAVDPSVAPPPAEPLANEVVEPAPSSSPRPIAIESAEEAYEESSAPRHTPPPESGKQVAAATSVKPDARKSSLPPDSPSRLGDWREPGIVSPSVVPSRGAPSRVPPPAAVQAAPPVSQVPAAPSVAPAPVNLAPEVTQVTFAADANVASIEGVGPSFSPATFGDLLDASLSL